ncbi:hypothetical protein [Catenulispora pinisilvae]|uniref:hypothetical protein n=1 Tax=Catenulispora pinisilvae TaxID=2705253 RepID=UPI001890C5AA|nr:hypothetical protein [Catenulispora pinisilvae]
MDVAAAVAVVAGPAADPDSVADPAADLVADPVGPVVAVRAGSPAVAERVASRDTCESVRLELPVARSVDGLDTGAWAFPEESSEAVGAEAPGASATSSFSRARSISGAVIASPATTAEIAERRSRRRRRGAVRRWLAGRRASGVWAPDQSSGHPDQSSEHPDQPSEYLDQSSEY